MSSRYVALGTAEEGQNQGNDRFYLENTVRRAV